MVVKGAGRGAASLSLVLFPPSPWSAAFAKDSTAYVKDADQYIVLKAAELELRNAIRDAPQDPVLRARLAEVYLQLGDALSAEREARESATTMRPITCRYWRMPCFVKKNSTTL
jgi:hypothetical protein